MKNIKICFTLLLLVLLGVACFEDESNYEYGTAIFESNSIKTDVKSSGYAWGTTIVVKPTEFSKGLYADLETIDSTKFRWEYYSADFAEDPTVPICTTFTFQRDLWNEGAVLNTAYTMLVRAIDSLGNVFDGIFSVKYSGYAYPTLNRWVLLARGSEGQSVIHLVSGITDTAAFKVYKDVATMGSGPRSIFFTNNWNVFGVQEESSGMTYMHPYTYALYRTPGQLFASGSVPAGEKLKKDVTVNGCISLAWCESGKVYYKIHENKSKYSSVKYPEKTLKHEDGTEVDCGVLLGRDQSEASRQNIVLYDKTKKGLYLVCGKDLKTAGKVVPVLPPVNYDGPLPSNNMDGYELLYGEMNGYDSKSYNMILKKDGKYYHYQVYFLDTDYYTAKVARSSNIILNEIVDNPLGCANDFMLYDIAQKPEYIFFVPELDRKSIYYYDLATGKTGVYMQFEGEGDINHIHFRLDNFSYQPKTFLGVAKGKKFYLLNAAAAYMQPTVAFEDKIMGEFEFDTEIVGFTYK